MARFVGEQRIALPMNSISRLSFLLRARLLSAISVILGRAVILPISALEAFRTMCVIRQISGEIVALFPYLMGKCGLFKPPAMRRMLFLRHAFDNVFLLGLFILSLSDLSMM